MSRWYLGRARLFAVPLLLLAAACGSEISDRSPSNGQGGNGQGGLPAGGAGTNSGATTATGGSGGSSSSSNGGSATATGGNSQSSAFTLACTEPKAGKPVLRLLTRGELERSLNDIFPPIKGQWTNALPADSVSGFGFDNDSAAAVGNQRAEAVLETALSVADAVTGAPLATILPCASSGANEACAKELLDKYGKRLFRRPLTSAEQSKYLKFFNDSLAKSDAKSAVKWTLAGLIQSPNTLYRREIGAEQGGTRKLNAYELATELAYTFTGSTPSDALLAQADSGNLGNLAMTAKSLLETEAGKASVQRFFEGYLGYTKVASIQHPSAEAGAVKFSQVSAAMAEETRRFVDAIVLQQRGGVKELLTAPTTNVSQELATYYGFPAPSANFASVTRPAGRGIGILAQGAFLATHATSDASSPTQRGLFVFQRLLCNDKPNPPQDVPALAAPQPGAKTTRQRYEEQHAVNQPCKGCHALFDPIGFGFEHFDEGGRFRMDEAGLPINSASSLLATNGGPGTAFSSQEELVSALANMPEVAQCLSGYLSTYAFGSGEPCLAPSRVPELQSGAIGIAEAFAAIAAEKHFSERSSR